MKSIFNGAGYLSNDDRCSGGKHEEADLLGCSHCTKLMKRSVWCDDGGLCHACAAPVCNRCADRIPMHGCEVFMRQLETALMKQYRLEQYARLTGLDRIQEK